MEEKRRDAAPSATDLPASEPASSRRRAGANKRKSSALGGSGSSSAPSKRAARDKASPLHPPSLHNGPLTRARQTPNSLAAAASGPAAVKHSDRAALAHSSAADSAALAEQLKKESEWETLEAAIEAEFEAIRSRGANAHVVPTHCGWFSWSCIHQIEKQMLPSFFNGKTENRTPDVYMEIRNWIMKKFHSNPNVPIDLKDMSELDVGDLDVKQEVMEFLDYWGLINFHPFPSMDPAVATASDDGEAEKNSLLEKFYHFETLQSCPPVQRSSQMTPATTSGLFPESTIAEELVKQEGPAVEMLEYHCNSCSADCSRKRYHCQKQADFDLCTDCYSNRRFGSGMSSLDFILMEPAEVAGVNGGKWTDQETLLLLEALELYKENWNEIAEHVGTKSKAQCILHFVQMPIEDTFVDCDDDVHAGCKETADPVAANNDSSMDKDASECIENDTSDGIKDHDKTSKAEDVEVKVNQEETPKLQEGSDEKASEGTSKSEDAVKVKFEQEAGNDCAINALKEAFAAVGYSAGPEGPSSFAEVGNPVMALATFLAHLVGSDVAVASAHSSIKSMSRNSPGTELAARCCFLLEDPPDNKKEATSSERDSKSEGDQDKVNVKQDKPMLDDKDLLNDHNNMKIESSALDDKGQPASTDDGASEKPISSKEQAMINHESGLDNCNDPNTAKLPNDQALGTHNAGGSTSKAEIPPSSDKVQEGNLIEEPCHSIKDRCVSDSLPSEKKEHQSIKSNLPGEHPKPVETSKYAEVVSDSIPSAKSKPQNPQSTNLVCESLETTDSVIDVDGVSNSVPLEKINSQPLSTSKPSQCNGTEKDIDMMSPSNPVRSNSGAENGSNTGAGKDHADNEAKVEVVGTKTKQDSNFEKVKRAAVSTVAAAAVKAKLLANQEEDQIRQLTSLLIEKQLHKLETKIAFFNDVESVVARAREHVERSRHKLYHERALIIASRLGIPASSSRGVPPSIPTNRIPTNIANSLPRPQIMMNPQRPLISRPAGTVASTLQNPLASSTAAGNSVRPSNQEKLSSVGTK
ncbi:SWI/SNF complex subunit SWI3D, partial [Mucuna pruriens]